MKKDQRRRAPRALAALVASTAVVAGALLLAAEPAVAEGNHTCDPFAGLHSDDGLLSDPIHHSVEPVLDPYLGLGTTHQLNCATVAHVDDVVAGLQCVVPQLLGQTCS